MFSQTIFDRFSSNLFFNGTTYLLFNNYTNQITELEEFEVVKYMMLQMKGEYYFSYLMKVFLEDYVVPQITKNNYKTDV